MQIKKWTLWSQDILTFTSFITLLKYFFKFFSSLVGKQVLFVLLYFQVRFFFSLSKWKKALIAQSCWTLWDPMDCSPPGSSVYGILQARILGWNAIPFSRGCSWLRDRTQVSCIADRFFTNWAPREVLFFLGTFLKLKTLIHAIWDSLVFWSPSSITILFYLYFLYLGWKKKISVAIKNRQGKSER